MKLPQIKPSPKAGKKIVERRKKAATNPGCETVKTLIAAREMGGPQETGTLLRVLGGNLTFPKQAFKNG